MQSYNKTYIIKLLQRVLIYSYILNDTHCNEKKILIAMRKSSHYSENSFLITVSILSYLYVVIASYLSK